MDVKTKNKVIVDVNGQTITVGVQQGKQTFKWLALVLQSRIKDLLQGKGNARTAQLETGNLVTGLLNDDDELIDPRDYIFEHAVWNEGEWKCKAQTSATFPSDMWGNPQYNEWTSTAYLNNENSFRFMMEMDDWRKRLEPGISNESGTNNKGADSNLIQIGDAPDIDTAFELDWSAMKWSWLPALSEMQKATLRTELRARYAVILFLFRHYCGAGELGQRYGMTLLEFSHLVQLALHVPPIPAAEDDLMSADAKDGDTINNSGSHISEDALIDPHHPAEAKTADPTPEPDRKGEKGAKGDDDAHTIEDKEAMGVLIRESHESVAPELVSIGASTSLSASSASKSKYNRTKSDARWVLLSRTHMTQALIYIAVNRSNSSNSSIIETVCEFIDGPLTRLWHALVTEYQMYKYSEEETFVDAFINTYAVLKQAFLTFGSTEAKEGPTMTQEQVIWLFQNSLFVGSSMTEAEQESSCVKAFRDCQLQSTIVSGAAQQAIDFDKIVFAEFLEVLASVALVSEHDSDMAVGKKMRLAFNTIAQLQPPPEASSKGRSDNESKK